MNKQKFRVGDWVYHPNTLVVRYREYTSHEFEVDLETCTTSAEMLDWVFQFSGKRWATRQAVGDLVYALHILLHPQQTLCSFGKEVGPITSGDKMRKQIANRLKQHEQR